MFKRLQFSRKSINSVNPNKNSDKYFNATDKQI